jgi:hypothetical protein
MRTGHPLIFPLAFGILSVVAICGAAARPPARGAVAMLFPPWWTQARSYAAAAAVGPVVRLGGLPFVMIVSPMDDRHRAEMHVAGAWWLMNPIVFTGCLQPVLGKPDEI